MSDSYYYTASFTEDEREILKDFFGRDLFAESYSSTAKELTDEQLDQISARIMPRARTSLRATDLLPSLRKFKALTETEYGHLRSGSLEPQEQALRLMEYLMYKGSYGLACLYLSLLTSSEAKRGLPAHYQLAGELKEIVREYGGSDDDTVSVLEGPVNGNESHIIPSLRAGVKKLQGISISPLAVQTLCSHFNIPSHQAPTTDLCAVCCVWLDSRSTCDVTELVEALVITEGVGRHTSRLCGPTAVAPRDLRNFLLTLGEQWVEIAKYLGFSNNEVATITATYPHSVGKQVDLFLEQWKMPDCGQKTLPLLHKLKTQAGIVEPKRDSLPPSRRPRLDGSGVPPRRLDPYSSPTKSTPPSYHRSPSTRTSDSHRHITTNDDGHYDNTPHYCPTHDTYTTSFSDGRTSLRLHMRFTDHHGSSGRHGERTINNQYNGYYNNDITNQDPVIEELPSDESTDQSPAPQSEGLVMGNEVAVPNSSSPPSRSAAGDPRKATPPLRSVAGEATPPSGDKEGSSSDHKRVTSRTEPHTVLLGNEVPMKRMSSVDGGSSGGKERGTTNATGGQLGNEIPLPGSGHLGNEVPVGVRGSRSGQSGRGLVGRGREEFLGNEVPMPGGRGSKKPGTARSHSSGSLGNEVPLPRSLKIGTNSVDRNAVQTSLPVGRGDQVGSGRLGNEAEHDSGFIALETTSVHSTSSSSSTARRKQLKSDSSYSSSSSSNPQQSTVELPTRMEAAGVSKAGIQRYDSQHSLSDNDLSGGEDDKIAPSLPTQTSNQLQNQVPRSPVAKSTPSRVAHPSDQTLHVGGEREGSRNEENGDETEDEGENNLDEEEEEEDNDTKVLNSVEEPPVASRQLNIPLPQHETTQGSGRQGEGGGRERGGRGDYNNDLSAPTPETPLDKKLSAPVFMQTSYNVPPESAGVTAPSLSSLNDLSTTEEAVPTPQPHVEAATEYCSEDVLQAIRDRNGKDMLIALVDSGADVNLPAPDGAYPLHVAVSSGRHETVMFLLDKQANISARRRDGKTPLHVACLQKDFEMVQVLVEKGADTTAQDEQGYTCLHFKETLETITIVKYLVHNAAPIDTPSYENYVTPLTRCCSIGNETFETVDFLVSKGASVNGYQKAGAKPLVAACRGGFEILIDLLLENDANVNIKDHEGMTPIIAAVLGSKTDLVKKLVTRGAIVNCYKVHTLSVGHSGSDITQEMSLLTIAAASGSVEMIELLVENGASVNPTTTHPTATAPIAIAAMCGRVDVVKRFLRLNDLDVRLPAIARPFTQAVKANQRPCAELLAEKYGGLELLYSDAIQNSMQDLADCIKQLKKMAPPLQATKTAPHTLRQLTPPGALTMPAQEREDHYEDMNNLSAEAGEDGENNMDEDTEAISGPGVLLNSLATPAQLHREREQRYKDRNNLAVTGEEEEENDLNDRENDLDEEEPGTIARPANSVNQVSRSTAAQTFTTTESSGTNPPRPSNVHVVSQDSWNNLEEVVSTQSNLSTGEGLGASAVSSNNLESQSDRLNVDEGTTVDSSAQQQNNLDVGETLNNFDTEAQNNLDVEASRTSDGALNNFDTVQEAQNNVDETGDVTSTAASNYLQTEVLNNFDVVATETSSNSPDTQSQNNFDEAANNNDTEEPNNFDMVEGMTGNAVEVSNGSPDTELQNNFDNTADAEVQNNFDRVTAEASNNSLNTQAQNNGEGFTSSTTQTGNYSLGNGPPANYEASDRVTGHVSPNNLDVEEVQNNFNEPTMPEESNFGMPPAPTSAPVARGQGYLDSGPVPTSVPVGGGRGYLDSSSPSGGPLRASVDSTSLSSLPSSTGGGENLFAPRPSSPPTRAPTPPRPSPYSMLSSVDAHTGGMFQQGGGGSGGSMEVLHDFAQICMMAADRTKGQEWLINKATETGYDNLTQFFIQFFHEGMALSIGGKLVSEFFGGNPSPLNFLIAGKFISQASCVDVARDLGQPDIMDRLTDALHQFPGSDGLPYTGSELAHALFNQMFSIGHRFPDPSSLWSSSSSYTPRNLSHATSSSSSQKRSFPGQGHKLGRDEVEQYSNLAEPAFHSTDVGGGGGGGGGGGSTNSPREFRDSLDNLTQSSLTPAVASRFTQSLPNTVMDRTDTTSLQSSSNTTQNSLPRQEVAPQLNSSSTSLPSTARDTVSNGPTTTLVTTELATATPTNHTLTEDGVFDEAEEVYQLNDLTTKDDHDLRQYYPKTQTDDADSQLLGNEIEVKPVMRPSSRTDMNPTPSSSTLSPPPSSPATHPPTNAAHPSPSSPPPLSTTHTSSPVSPSTTTESSHVQSNELSGPEAKPPATTHHNTVTVSAGGSLPPSVTPSPEPPEIPLPQDTVLQGQSGAVLPSENGPLDLTPQSSSGVQSPQLSSRRGSVVGVTGREGEHMLSSAPDSTKPVNQVPSRPTSSGSAGSKESRKSVNKSTAPKRKDIPTTKTQRSATPAKKKTVVTPAASNSRSKQPTTKPSTVSLTKKPPTSPRLTSTAQTKPASPRLGHKVTKMHTKDQPLGCPRHLSRTSTVKDSRVKTSMKKPLLTASKPPSRTTKKVGSRLEPAPAMSRGLHKGKGGKSGGSAGTSLSSLTDEEVAGNDYQSMPFKTLEPMASGSEVPCDSERYAVLSGDDPTSLSDGISFPDSVIHSPENCAMFEALAHRVRKWKIFGRYLGLSDDELDTIERSNHFTTERCLKMLVHWGKNYRGKYSELEAGIHNIMREDLIEDMRQYLPLEVAHQCSEADDEHRLKFPGFKVEGGVPDVQKLAKSVTDLVRRQKDAPDIVWLRFSHEKLCVPLQIYIPLSHTGSTPDCDLTVLEELCFAAWKRSVVTVDLEFETHHNV